MGCVMVAGRVQKVVGRSPIGCIMVAGRVQQGCGKVINRLWEGHL